jgi:cell division protein FtsX
MLEFLKWLGVFCGPPCIMAAVLAVAACIRSAQIARREERQ